MNLNVFQDMYAAFEVNPIIDQPNEVSFYFNLDAPREALSKKAIIYQWAQLSDKNDANADKIGIVCKVQIGNPAGTEVAAF